jgi:hypothetical protein
MLFHPGAYALPGPTDQFGGQHPGVIPIDDLANGFLVFDVNRGTLAADT